MAQSGMTLLRRAWARSRAGVPAEKKLTRDAVASLFIHGFFQFGASMSGIFLNLYLWRLTESLWVNGMYSLITFLVGPFAFALAGWLCKRRDRLVSYRSGIALIALFYLLVIVAQEQVADYYVLFAIFSGTAGAFYWAGYLTLMYDVSTEANRLRYLAFNMIAFNAAGLLGPALAGYIISRSGGLHGYMFIFAAAFVMFLIAIVGSFRLGRLPSRNKTYYLKYAVLLMKKDRRWLQALIGFFIFGLLQGIMLFLPNILLYKVLPYEDKIGYFNMLFSGIIVATGFAISKFARESFVRRYMCAAACGFIIGSALLLWNLSLFTVIAFMIVYSISNPLQGNSITSYYYRLTARLPLKGQFRIESIVARESFLNMGRVVAILSLITLSGNLDAGWLPWVLFIASALQLNLIWIVRSKL